MDDGERIGLAEALRARLAAAGLEVPAEDAARLERDLALHLERVAALTGAADLDPSDPPLTDPTRARAGLARSRVSPSGLGPIPTA